jgi:hypothetical protein
MLEFINTNVSKYTSKKFKLTTKATEQHGTYSLCSGVSSTFTEVPGSTYGLETSNFD